MQSMKSRILRDEDSLNFLSRWKQIWVYRAVLLGNWAAGAAKSLQSCPTLCDPIGGSPPGSRVPGILQARTLEWVAISYSTAWKWKVKGSHSVVSDSSRPHGLQPTRLLRTWDLPGKSTGVGCHRLLWGTGLPHDKSQLRSALGILKVDMGSPWGLCPLQQKSYLKHLFLLHIHVNQRLPWISPSGEIFQNEDDSGLLLRPHTQISKISFFLPFQSSKSIDSKLSCTSLAK